MSRLKSRWTMSPRSASPEDALKLAQDIDRLQPSFWTAVKEDARITAKYRGEHHKFRSDFDALGQVVRLIWVTDTFLAQLCYRAGVECRIRKVPLIPAIFRRIAVITGQLSIGDKVVMDPGVYFPHGQVVIDGLTHVGSGAVIRPFVTIGLRDGDMVGPTIGEGARLGTGAKVFGPVRVGVEARVGANAVVNSDVPDEAVVVGVPARQVR